MGVFKIVWVLLIVVAAATSLPQCAFQTHGTFLAIARTIPIHCLRPATISKKRASAGRSSLDAARCVEELTPVQHDKASTEDKVVTSSSRRAFLSHVAAGATAWTAAGAVVLRTGGASCGAAERGVDEVKKGIEKDFLSGYVHHDELKRIFSLTVQTVCTSCCTQTTHLKCVIVVDGGSLISQRETQTKFIPFLLCMWDRSAVHLT